MDHRCYVAGGRVGFPHLTGANRTIMVRATVARVSTMGGNPHGKPTWETTIQGGFSGETTRQYGNLNDATRHSDNDLTTEGDTPILVATSRLPPVTVTTI